MLDINLTLIIIAISFIVFTVVMQKIFYAPMTEVRQERDKYIDNNRKTAFNSREEAVIIVKDYEEKILHAKLKANEVVTNSTASANKKKYSVLEESSNNISIKLKSAKEEILKNTQEAKDQLKPHVIALAHSISSKILGEEVSISGLTPDMVDKYFNR